MNLMQSLQIVGVFVVDLLLNSQNELSSPIAANFCPTIFFGLDFHFYVIFLLIGIGQLDNDV